MEYKTHFVSNRVQNLKLQPVLRKVGIVLLFNNFTFYMGLEDVTFHTWGYLKILPYKSPFHKSVFFNFEHHFFDKWHATVTVFDLSYFSKCSTSTNDSVAIFRRVLSLQWSSYFCGTLFRYSGIDVN